MVTTLPEKLRTAEISPFALRAAQVEKVRPIISYWCNYWIVQQILSRSLHTQDNDCLAYTTNLMDKLEQVKTENAVNDAIQDDVAAQAYVEQFGLETFSRADTAVRADKVSAQTADTFQAAATFLNLLQIFGPLDPEIAAKSKYAKYHAVRIAKAIKAGEDPNLSNPKAPPPPTVEDAVGVDENDPDVQITNGDTPSAPIISGSEPAPVLYTPNAKSSTAVSPVGVPMASGSETLSPYPDQGSPEVSPEKDRSNSVGGGYFPSAPATFSSENPEPSLPTAPEIPSAPSGIPPSPPIAPSLDPSSFYTTTPTPATAPAFAPVPAHSPVPAPAPLSHPTTNVTSPPPPVAPVIPSVPSVPSVLSPPTQPLAYAPSAQVLPPTGGYRADEESVVSAQKHARWAVSALNFEDVDTAVKELNIALQALGAR
ncbi:DUF605-domain-containing protein [Viridothelium virens]|uniref:DUF605-domain-containing protein n=1 Tax=Viridothelium virens TaxID=1048519 RepID=A0A6A6GYP9_VIRVR|nr:DUF605-domain-containing protein [Viridothelium virens]